MKILVWGINYAPEATGIAPQNTALCEYLARRGHEVRIVTAFPYYPEWRKRPEDRRVLFRTEITRGVTVHRCWHFVPRAVSTFKRAVHEGAFVLTSLLRVLSLPRCDVAIVISPPLLLGWAAWLAGRLKRFPFVFHVQDLQPGAAAALGLVKRGALLDCLRWLEKFSYRRALAVGGISSGMIAHFIQLGVAPEKCVLFPNGLRMDDYRKPPDAGAFRRAHGIADADFLAVYAGNLGEKQGLDTLLEAAAMVKNPAIQIIICGDGNQRSRLARRLSDAKLANVRMFGLLPFAEYRAMLDDADVCVVPQKPGAGAAFFPSKLLPALACGKPVLAVTDAESALAAVVAEGRFGKSVAPGNPGALAAALTDMAAHPEQGRQWGRAGREFVRQFDHEQVLRDFERKLCARLK